MAQKEKRYVLVQDKKGMMWDLLLYVPTVIFLISIALKLWYSADKNWSYLLMFLGSFFFFVGTSRILKSRLMILPSAPVALDVSKQRVRVELRNGSQVDLVKDVRFFPDFAGKSMAVTGMDLSGKKQQYVFHRGQFADNSAFDDAKSWLNIYR